MTPVCFSVQLLLSWLTTHDFYGLVAPDTGPAEAWPCLVVAILNLPKTSLERRYPDWSRGRGRVASLCALPVPALPVFLL